VRHGAGAGHERCALPQAVLQDSDVIGSSWEGQHHVSGDAAGADWKLPRRGDRLALSTSSHADQRLHRQPRRLRPHGYSVLYLGSPGRTSITQLYLGAPG